MAPPVTRVIRSFELVNGHAMSTDNQAYLGELLEEMRNPSQELLIVVGAGSSMESGLPSWHALIANIAEKNLDAEHVAGLSLLEQDNIQRRALMTLSMAREEAPGLDEADLIREGLFQRAALPDPGPLTNSVVRLALSFQRPVRIMTTNYDPLLEDALGTAQRRRARGFSIAGASGGDQDLRQWKALEPNQWSRAVLHLHGMIPENPRDPVLEPLLLSETDYLTFGPQVISAIAGEMKNRTSIFVGLSMTDSNLLAALRKLARSNSGSTRSYAISVPQLEHSDLSRDLCAEVATSVARRLESDYGLRPILLKSFMQVSQLVSELSLASKEPRRYTLDSSSKSLKYGTRYGLIMRGLYDAIGADQITGAIPGEEAQRLTGRFAKAIASDVLPLLTECSRQHRGEVAPDEHFGAFIWLRDIRDLNGDGFGIRFVSSSVYAHTDPRSGERVEPIVANSPYAAVQAVYYGQYAAININATPGRSQTWRGSTAWPITLTQLLSNRTVGGAPLDQLTVGSVALNTNAFVTSPDGTVPPEETSVLALLNDDESYAVREALIDSVYETMFD